MNYMEIHASRRLLDAIAKRHATVRSPVNHLTDLSVAAERDRPGPVAFADDDDHLVVEVEGGEVHKDASWSGQRAARAFFIALASSTTKAPTGDA
jgi:hypothetical protein